MTDTKTRKRSIRKRILLTILVLVVIGAGVYWYVATEKFSDTKDRKSAFTVNAIDFIREFRQNHDSANRKYSDQIITVRGRVSAVEAADTTLNLKFVDSASNNSYVIFAFQQQHLAEAKSVQPGDSVAIKGSCSGGVFSEILEAESISFKRSTLDKKY